MIPRRDSAAIPLARRLSAAFQEALPTYPELAVVYLFGSVARGDEGPGSDVDLGLLFRDPGATALEHHRLLGDLASRLEAFVEGRRIDLIVLDDQPPLFAFEVLADGVIVYEADRERRIDFESTTYVRAMDFRPTYEIATQGMIDKLRSWLQETP